MTTLVLEREPRPAILQTPLDRWIRLPEKHSVGSAKNLDVAEVRQRIRVNALCSLYYTAFVLLDRTKLNRTLHEPLCRYLHKPTYREVLEIPRGHCKSTIVTESLPIWRTLRVTEADANYILRLRTESDRFAYDDGFIRYLLAMHNPNQCWLIANENARNAARLLRRIRQHWESGKMLRATFNDLLPASIAGGDSKGRYKGKWGDAALCLNRTGRRGEATYECIGVGGAVQSAHYDHVIEDDLVGREAINSGVTMEDVIGWHRLLPGVFENARMRSQIVVGNRWSFYDLDSWIRENEPDYTFHTRASLECPVCGKGTRLMTFTQDMARCQCGRDANPIYPEEFDIRALFKLRETEGPYNFSCQRMNNPASPESAVFKEEWLAWYEFGYESRYGPEVEGTRVALADGTVGKANCIRHTGEFSQLPPISVWRLSRFITVDPSHGSTDINASRHAIVVTGIDEHHRKYLLDVWAEHASPDVMIQKLYQMATKWKVHVAYCEAIAGQKYLPYHLNVMNEKWDNNFRVEGLTGFVDTGAGGLTNRKEARITNLSPVFERREMFVRQDQAKFLDEYLTFPKGKYADILDALGYGPVVWQRPISSREMAQLQGAQQRMLMTRNPATGY